MTGGLRIGSLCAGIGGLESGVPGEVAWLAEVDLHASQVLAARVPAPNLGDLTAVDWNEVEPVDVLTAGYPCQPFSTAGRRQGADDDRHLWPHVADAVRQLRPRWVLLENVRGHLSLGFGDVLGDLAALGFDAEWCVLRASDVGAPHRRERVFIVAADTDEQRPQGTEPARRRHMPPGGGTPHAPADAGDGGRRGWAPCDEPGVEGRDGLPPVGGEGVGVTPGGAGPAPDAGRGVPARRPLGRYEPAVRRWEAVHGPAPDPLDDRDRLDPRFVEWMMGYPPGWVTDPALDLPRTAQLRCLGNAVVPQCSALAWRLLTARHHAAALVEAA